MLKDGTAHGQDKWVCLGTDIIRANKLHQYHKAILSIFTLTLYNDLDLIWPWLHNISLTLYNDLHLGFGIFWECILTLTLYSASNAASFFRRLWHSRLRCSASASCSWSWETLFWRAVSCSRAPTDVSNWDWSFWFYEEQANKLIWLLYTWKISLYFTAETIVQ